MAQNIADNQNGIKQLPKQFSGRGEVRGFQFTLICKTEHAFLYEVQNGGHLPHYEVFLLKINIRFNCESYPTAKAFGIWAWTNREKKKALLKLFEIS